MTAAAPAPSRRRQAEALVGLPYVEGEFDCGHLVVRAARELFGREVVLPLNGPHPLQARDQVAAIAACRRDLARRVWDVAPGDLALMLERMDDGTQQWHLGTVVDVQPEVWLLHTRAGGASGLHRLADVQRWGLRVEGWYRWV